MHAGRGHRSDSEIFGLVGIDKRRDDIASNEEEIRYIMIASLSGKREESEHLSNQNHGMKRWIVQIIKKCETSLTG